MKGYLKSMTMVIWALAAGGCGYHFQGASGPGATIEVPIFVNHTVETGIEAQVTDRMIEELRRTPGWHVVGAGLGRYALEGVIAGFSTEPTVVSSAQHLAREMRADLHLEVTLRDRQEGRNLWAPVKLDSFADYQVGENVLENERNKLDAIERIAEELAQRVRVRLQDTWPTVDQGPSTAAP
jgi:hypothetical protein